MTLKQLWIALWIALAAFGAFWLGTRSSAPETTVLASFRPAFALADADGRTRTTEEFRDKHLLVLFGFTNCPDVCPTTLSEVAQVMDDLGKEADKVLPVFISIDPKRDGGLGLAEFTGVFHQTILGLAGDTATTRAASESFKIFFEREEDAVAPGGYTMAHSSALYLVGPEGDWLRQFDYGIPAPEILNDLKSRL